jgi:hypothetical protein
MNTINDLVDQSTDILAAAKKRRANYARQARAIFDRANRENRSAVTGAEQAELDELSVLAEQADAEVTKAERRLARAKAVANEMATEDRMATQTREFPPSPHRAASFSVTRNERTYRPDTDPNGVGFLRDVASNFLYNDPNASARLARHSQEERVERPQYSERVAGDVTTTNWAGLVVPQYLVELVAPQISPLRPFADACTVKHNLPPNGMSVNISRVTTGSTADLQASELAGVSMTTLDDTLLTVNVQTVMGALNVSRQALDRGQGVEQQSFLDLSRKLAAKLDSTILNQAVHGVTNIAHDIDYTDANPTAAELYPYIMQAGSQLEQALEGVAMPSHVVMHSRRFNWLAAEVGSSWPFLNGAGVPAQSGGMHLTNEYGPQVRAVLSNGMKIVVDNNITTAAGGTQDEIYVVAANESVHLWEDPAAPVYIRAEQPNVASLGVLLVIYEYFAYTGERYANGIQKISDTGLAAPTGF